jgi:hypothetical protein
LQRWKNRNKVSSISDINGIPISIEFAAGYESDNLFLLKNINDFYIDIKICLYKNNNIY